MFICTKIALIIWPELTMLPLFDNLITEKPNIIVKDNSVKFQISTKYNLTYNPQPNIIIKYHWLANQTQFGDIQVISPRLYLQGYIISSRL